AEAEVGGIARSWQCSVKVESIGFRPLIRASRTFSPQAGRRATTLMLICVAPRPACGERVAEGRVRGVLAEALPTYAAGRAGSLADIIPRHEANCVRCPTLRSLRERAAHHRSHHARAGTGRLGAARSALV